MHYCAEHFRIIEEACVVLVAAEHASFTPAEEPSLLISRQTELQPPKHKSVWGAANAQVYVHKHTHIYMHTLEG